MVVCLKVCLLTLLLVLQFAYQEKMTKMDEDSEVTMLPLEGAAVAYNNTFLPWTDWLLLYLCFIDNCILNPISPLCRWNILCITQIACNLLILQFILLSLHKWFTTVVKDCLSAAFGTEYWQGIKDCTWPQSKFWPSSVSWGIANHRNRNREIVWVFLVFPLDMDTSLRLFKWQKHNPGIKWACCLST